MLGTGLIVRLRLFKGAVRAALARHAGPARLLRRIAAVFRDEGVYAQAQSLAVYFEDAVHSLKGEPHIVDIRNTGLAAAVTVETRPGAPGARGTEVFLKTYEHGVAIRANGDHLAMAPILTMGRTEIDMTIDALRKALRAAD